MNEKLTALLKNKRLIWLLCSIPLWIILSQAFSFSPAQYKFWSQSLAISGYFAVVLLSITLCLAPLSKHFPGIELFLVLNRHKKQTGLACFYYVLIHVFSLCVKVVMKKGFFPWPILLRPYVVLGEVAFLILLVLALTSNRYSKTKLGWKWWKFLHRIVYLAEAAIFFHMVLQGREMLVWAFVIFVPVVAIQLLRVPHKS